MIHSVRGQAMTSADAEATPGGDRPPISNRARRGLLIAAAGIPLLVLVVYLLR